MPMTSTTTPTGTRTKAVHQTAKPTLIATTPLTSQRHAPAANPQVEPHDRSF
jgi:hypothetical protein